MNENQESESILTIRRLSLKILLLLEEITMTNYF